MFRLLKMIILLNVFNCVSIHNYFSELKQSMIGIQESSTKNLLWQISSLRKVFLSLKTGECALYTRVGVYIYIQGCYSDACKLLSVQTSCYLKNHEGFFLKGCIFIPVIETFIVFLTVLLLLMQKRQNKGLLVARGKLTK